MTRPEAIRAMMETILHVLWEDTGQKPAKKARTDERKHAVQNSAAGALAKGMAQKALAASPNRQWTENEMQSVDEWIARQESNWIVPQLSAA
jgi:hypothetical protein